MAETSTPDTRHKLRNRVRYRFDNLLARGTWAVLLWLGIITLGAVLFSSGLLAIFGVDFAGSQENTWIEDFWQSLLRVFDPGTMAGDVGWGRRVLALVITIFGILIAGTLIGLIANGVEERVEAMRRGRSTVVENGHIVILGASNRLPVVIEQLAMADGGRRSRAIVVLTDREPVQLSHDVSALVPNLRSARVVFRSGDPARLSDLAMVAIRAARAVIVLADDDALGDGGVVRAVLAVGSELGGFDRMPIVAELTATEAAESLVRACGGTVEPVVAARSVGRITAFSLREPGLNQVMEELLDFRGCEIHLRAVSELAGLPFGEAVFRFPTARPIGRIRADGEVDLNPDPQAGLRLGDQLVLVADDDQATPSAQAFARALPAVSPVLAGPGTRRREHVLIVGWNSLGAHLLASLDELATPGSTAEILYDPGLLSKDDVDLPPLDTIDVALRPGTAAAWQIRHESRVQDITSIVLLAQRDGIPPEEADSRTLLTHMLLRRELEAAGGAVPRIVVELLDAQNVELARLAGADDYVVSDALTSRIIAQLAEEPQRRPILLQLYAPGGPSIRLVPTPALQMDGDMGFGEIVAVSYAAGLLAIGWRSGGQVVLNPDVSTRVVLSDGDQIIAIG